jgi:hypothetical protein
MITKSHAHPTTYPEDFMNKRINAIIFLIFALAFAVFSQDDSSQPKIQDLQGQIDSLQKDSKKLSLPINISFWGFLLGGTGTLLTGYPSYPSSSGSPYTNPIYSMPVSIGCAAVAVGGIIGMWICFDKKGAIKAKVSTLDSQIDKIKADALAKQEKEEADKLAAQRQADLAKKQQQDLAERQTYLANKQQQVLAEAKQIVDGLNAKVPELDAYAKKNNFPLAPLDSHIALDSLNKTLSLTMRQFLTVLYSYKDFLSLGLDADGKTLTVSYKTYEDVEAFTFRIEGNLAYIKIIDSQSDFKNYTGSDAENQFIMIFGIIEDALVAVGTEGK